MKQIQDKIKQLVDGLCLALCYTELWGIKNDGDKLKIIAEAVRQGYVGWDGTVKNPIGLAKLCGHMEVKDIKNPTTYEGHDTVVANFTYNGFNHFVLVKDGEVVWNSIEHSKCVENGKIESFRIPVTN